MDFLSQARHLGGLPRASPVPFRSSSFTLGVHPPSATLQRLIACLYRPWSVLLMTSVRFVAHFPLNHHRSACQSKRRTRPPRTTARMHDRQREDEEAGKGGRCWPRAGVRPVSFGHIRCGGGGGAAGGTEVAELRRPLGNRGRMGALDVERPLPSTPLECWTMGFYSTRSVPTGAPHALC
jgi:hypothetical protein